MNNTVKKSRYTEYRNEVHDARKFKYSLQPTDINTSHDQLTELLTVLHPNSTFKHHKIPTTDTKIHKML